MNVSVQEEDEVSPQSLQAMAVTIHFQLSICYVRRKYCSAFPTVQMIDTRPWSKMTKKKIHWYFAENWNSWFSRNIVMPRWHQNIDSNYLIIWLSSSAESSNPTLNSTSVVHGVQNWHQAGLLALIKCEFLFIWGKPESELTWGPAIDL